MLPSHQRAMHDLVQCRTPDLGEIIYRCDHCGHQVHAYLSCRNRHCPQCQTDRADRWFEKSTKLLLPCNYFLFTFTLPEELRSVARSNQRIVYDILIRAAARSLLVLTEDPKYVGGRIAILAILHTWSRAMVFHPHVHLLVTAGGLAPDGSTWLKSANPKFLAPGFALQVIFKAKVREALQEVGLGDLAPKTVWRRKKKWVVHGKYVGSGDQALRYLARYVFRVAISNDRIESFDGENVTFRFKDVKSGQTKRTTLPVNEFIRRFLQHVLPRGFVKVRYYGLWAPACREKLDTARRILEHHQHQLADSPSTLLDDSPDGVHEPPLRLCPVCKVGLMVMIDVILRSRAPP
jgi:hypothetical protein